MNRSEPRRLPGRARAFGFDVIAAVNTLQELLHAEIGILLELFEGALCRDFAIQEQEAMVGDLAGTVHIVGDDDAGDAEFAAEFIDELIDAVRADGIQPGGGLVVEDDAWLEHDGAGEGDAFALAARELGGEFVLDTFEVDQFKCVADFLQPFSRGEGGVFDEGKGDVVGNAHGVKEGGELEEKSDLQANRDQIALAELVDALIFDPDLATAGLQQADDVLQKDGFATAGGAHNDGGLATGDIDVDTVKDHLRAKGAVHVDQSDGVTGGGG